jgi:hypothetical protein
MVNTKSPPRTEVDSIIIVNSFIYAFLRQDFAMVGIFVKFYIFEC